MPRPQAIEAICASRDAAIDALDSAVTSVGSEIVHTIQTGPYLHQLTRRYQDLMNERSAIRSTATDAVLGLPGVMAAAATLGSLSTQMQATAVTLPEATNLLLPTATVLALGQQFVDAVASAQRVSA
jgi:hypothetical protein